MKTSFGIPAYYLRFLTGLMTNVCTNAISTEARRAVANPSISKELPIMDAVNINVPALMTNKNNPSVNIVIGSVSMMRIGFTIALTIESSTLAIKAAPKPDK